MSSVSNTDAALTEPSRTRSVRAVLISQRDLTVMLKVGLATWVLEGRVTVGQTTLMFALCRHRHTKRNRLLYSLVFSSDMSGTLQQA